MPLHRRIQSKEKIKTLKRQEAEELLEHVKETKHFVENANSKNNKSDTDPLLLSMYELLIQLLDQALNNNQDREFIDIPVEDNTADIIEGLLINLAKLKDEDV